MKWVTEPPKETGFYFFRHYSDYLQEYGEPTVIQLDKDGIIWLIGSEIDYPVKYETMSLYGDKIEMPEVK